MKFENYFTFLKCWATNFIFFNQALKKKGKVSRLPTLITSCDEQVFSTFDFFLKQKLLNSPRFQEQPQMEGFGEGHGM